MYSLRSLAVRLSIFPAAAGALYSARFSSRARLLRALPQVMRGRRQTRTTGQMAPPKSPDVFPPNELREREAPRSAAVLRRPRRPASRPRRGGKWGAAGLHHARGVFYAVLVSSTVRGGLPVMRTVQCAVARWVD